VLIKALQDVGEGSWFSVVEREKVDNLLKERQIITQMRMTYLGEKQINPQALPPLLFAAIIFEGGIIGFDSNTQTGGVGAGLLGIRGDVKYRMDTITVYLRAVSTKTGQVLASVTTHKTIASVGVQGGAFKYIAFDKILEAEAGITKNEPDQLAVQQAIEKAVHTIIVEGAGKGIWSFEDELLQDELIRRHAEEYDTEYSGGPSIKDGAYEAAAANSADMTPTASLPANGWAARQHAVAAETAEAQQPATNLASAVAQPQQPPG
jgi:curli production assembly/transport component CsgG